MKRVLVTGASGFVGANLVRRLVDEGHEVHVLLRRDHHSWRLKAIQDALNSHVVDLGDLDRLRGIVRNIRPEWVFHLAAHGAYPEQTDPRAMIQANILGILNLVESCLEAGVETIVNTGSSSEYGRKAHPPEETEWLEPNSYYAITKASASMLCRYIAQSQGVRIPTLRLYSVYGPYEQSTRLIPTLIRHGLRGELPPLVHPTTARDFVYVDDVVEAYLLAAQTPRQENDAVYNVGTGIQTNLADVVAVIRRLMGIAVDPIWSSMPSRAWDTSTWVACRSRITDQLGWEPRHDLESGLKRAIAWTAQHPGLGEGELSARG